MTAEEYIAKLIRAVPSVVKDAMDPQIIQAELAIDISDNLGDETPNPIYPRAKGGKLNLVKKNLFRAATVYKGRGNVSKTTGSGSSFAFQWGIDLDVVPYARIHDLGGKAGRGLKSTIPARPYITPAMETFSGGKGTIDASKFTASTSGFARIINEIYLRLSLI